MNRWLSASLATLVVVTLAGRSSAAANRAEITSIKVAPDGTSIQPCCAIVRGIYNASTKGADFELKCIFVYRSSGVAVTQATSVLVRETSFVQDLDRQWVLVDFVVPLAKPVDPGSEILADVEVDIR